MKEYGLKKYLMFFLKKGKDLGTGDWKNNKFHLDFLKKLKHSLHV